MDLGGLLQDQCLSMQMGGLRFVYAALVRSVAVQIRPRLCQRHRSELPHPMKLSQKFITMAMESLPVNQWFKKKDRQRRKSLSQAVAIQRLFLLWAFDWKSCLSRIEEMKHLSVNQRFQGRYKQ